MTRLSTMTLGAALAGVALAGLAGCSAVQPVAATDEFLVLTKPPLSVPPEYNLRPPSPGVTQPNEVPSAEQARRIIFGTDAGRDSSEGERALVAAAGGESISEALRAEIDFEAASRVAKNAGFTRRFLALLGLTESDVLDPEAEAARLAREAESIAQVTGGKPVIIVPREQAEKLPGT